MVVFDINWLYSDKVVAIRIKHFKESGLAPETMLRTQSSCPFPKPEKWLIFGILAKREPHEKFLESFNVTNGCK